MQCRWFEDEENSEQNAVGFVEISEKFEIQNTFCFETGLVDRFQYTDLFGYVEVYNDLFYIKTACRLVLLYRPDTSR